MSAARKCCCRISIAFANNAAMAGIDVCLHVAAGMPHAWPLFHFYLSAAREAIDETGAWIRQRLA